MHPCVCGVQNLFRVALNYVAHFRAHTQHTGSTGTRNHNLFMHVKQADAHRQQSTNALDVEIGRCEKLKEKTEETTSK